MCAAAAAGRHEWRDEAGHYGGDAPNTVSCFLSGEVKRNKKDDLVDNNICIGHSDVFTTK